MSDVKASLLSRLTNLFPSDAIVATSAVDNRRDNDRSSVADAKPQRFEREESFYWTWQYPSQW
jgi:hypothetical protein